MSSTASALDQHDRMVAGKPGADLARKLFKAGILISMTVPMFIYFMHTFFTASFLWRPWYFLIPFIGALSGTHVFATTYLYIQPGSFKGIPHKYLLLFIAPIAIIALNLYAFTLMPTDALFWFLALYGFYVLFHFGRQNVGVLSFAALSSARRPIHATEKKILNGVVACGMLAAPKLLEVGLLMDAARFSTHLAQIQPAIHAFYFLGGLGYVVLLGVAFRHFMSHRAAYDWYTATIFWLCVVWYLPLYISLKYPLLSFALFTTAHGLQYLVFLALHVYTKSTSRLTAKSAVSQIPAIAFALVPAAAFLCIIYAAFLLWSNSSVLFSGSADFVDSMVGSGGVAKVGAGLVAGMTLAHYWVDQFIWRFKSPERRSWLMENYPFLVHPRIDERLVNR